jgi:hypothetical protein
MAKNFRPTKEQRAEVERNITAGIDQVSIAHMLGLSRSMLNHYFPDEIKFGRSRKLAAYIKLLERAADDLNVSAIKRLIDIATVPTAATPDMVGKKAAADRDAQTAGDGTEWGDDLRPLAN